MMFLHPLMKIVCIFALLSLVATAAATTNIIQVFVHPGSGSICVDTTCQVARGSLSGYSSTQFDNVAGGRDHTIRVYDTNGYEDYSDTFYMDYNGDTVTRQIYLVPVATETPAPATTSSGTGTVRVIVSPGLGQVCIDNRECESSNGAASASWNVDFNDVTAGSAHTIAVTADGYETASTQITVLPDQVNEANITLQPIPSAADTSVPKTQAGSDGLITLVAAGICGIIFMWKHGD
jgi:hypothetical protein